MHLRRGNCFPDLSIDKNTQITAVSWGVTLAQCNKQGSKRCVPETFRRRFSDFHATFQTQPPPNHRFHH